MKNLINIWVILFGIILIGCNDESDPIAPVDPVKVIEIPSTYTFLRDGQTSVSYGGQTSRLEMAAELGSHLNNETKTKEELVNMFDNGTGFGNPALALSGKKLGNDLQFRTTIEFSYELNNENRIGLSFGHISNANLGDKNPGVEILSLTYQVPY